MHGCVYSQTQVPLYTYIRIPAASVTMIDCIGNITSERVVWLPLFMGLVYFNSAHELKNIVMYVCKYSYFTYCTRWRTVAHVHTYEGVHKSVSMLRKRVSITNTD